MFSLFFASHVEVCILYSRSLCIAAAALFSKDVDQGFAYVVLMEQLKSFDLDTNLTTHKHWTCGLFSQGTKHYSTCRAFLQRQGTIFFEYSLALGPIEFGHMC